MAPLVTWWSGVLATDATEDLGEVPVTTAHGKTALKEFQTSPLRRRSIEPTLFVARAPDPESRAER
jgi:hypothetical protein